MSKGILGRLDSLVNELGEGRACWGHDFIDAAVDAMDRIEELEAQLSEKMDEDAYIAELEYKLDAAEDKLAKAVEALQKIATVTKDGTGHNLAPVVRLAQRIEGISRATLAELKGEQL